MGQRRHRVPTCRWRGRWPAAARSTPASSSCTLAGESRLDAGTYLCLGYRGPNTRNAELVPRLLAEARARDLAPAGPLLEFLLADIHTSADDADHVTELQLRVAPAR